MATQDDVIIYIGDTWQHQWQWIDAVSGDPVDLTGWTATLELFNASGVLLDTLTSAGGDITITAATGMSLVEMSKTDTALLTAQTGSYHLHMDHVASGHRERLAYGYAVMVA
jgi:hypothetical protein